MLNCITMKKKIICIVGPTAAGKTKLGVELANKYNGEIISADSRQVYKGLDIGTGKDLSEYGNIKHHLIDICEKEERFTLFGWLKLARLAIDDVCSRQKIPIVVGGTGLYIQALVEGFQLVSANSELQNRNFKTKIYTRKELEGKSLEQLQEIYNRLPATNNRIDLNNPHRLIRAIEKVQNGIVPTKKQPKFDTLQIGINLPRQELYKRIDRRVDRRFEKEGMLEEVRNLLNKGVDPRWLSSLGLEYRIISSYLSQETKGEGNFEEMKQELKHKSHAFARRQLTWYRRFPEIKWITDFDEAEKAVDKFLQK